MSLTPQEIKDIVVALQDSEWDQATVTVGDVRIAVGRNGISPGAEVATAPATTPVAAAAPVAATPPVPAAAAPPAPVSASTATAANASGSEGHLVTAPSVGVFWKTPQPGQPPFVEIGSEIEAGDTLCIVEVMKLMNNVTSDIAGTVVAVHQDNATQVEFGTPLFTIAPREA
jgi:acetyl-CoA carboxylase biotin carboxyl carrier protein